MVLNGLHEKVLIELIAPGSVRVVASERLDLREKFVGGDAPGINIGAVVDRFAQELFRGHVGRRAGNFRKFLGLPGQFPGGVKINQAHLPV